MAMVAFLRLGDIAGWYNDLGALSSDNKGGPTYAPVFAFEHEAKVAIDPKTGKPTKEVSHSPFVITKRVDPTSPRLHERYKNNTIIKPWELKLFQIPMGEGNPHYFSIKLTDARVASINTIKPPMTAPISGAGHEIEKVAFVYTTIEWEAPMMARLTLEAGNAPVDSFTEPGTFYPDWIEEQAKTAVQKMLGLLYARVKAAATAELIQEGIAVPEEK